MRIRITIIIVVTLFCSIIGMTVQAGTIAHWKFEEGVGSAFVANGGTRNNGVLVNQASFVSDTRSQVRSKYSVQFDGENDIAVVPDSPSLRVQNALTIEVWVKPSSNARVIIGKQLGTQCCVNSYQIELNPFRFQLTDSSGQDYLIGPGYEPSADKWHHIAGTWDGTTMRLYLDRRKVASGSFSGQIDYDANPVLIGGEDDGAGVPGGSMFQGLIDDIRISNTALLPSLFFR